MHWLADISALYLPYPPPPTYMILQRKLQQVITFIKPFCGSLKQLKPFLLIYLYTLLLNPTPKKECCLKIWKNDNSKRQDQLYVEKRHNKGGSSERGDTIVWLHRNVPLAVCRSLQWICRVPVDCILPYQIFPYKGCHKKTNIHWSYWAGCHDFNIILVKIYCPNWAAQLPSKTGLIQILFESRVAKRNFFYTDHFCPTKFTPIKSA